MPLFAQPEWVDRRAADIAAIVAQYPQARSALLPLLHLAQAERGYLSEEDMEAIAEILGVSAGYVKSTASFYAMYHWHPTGRYLFTLCGNLSCAMSGANPVLQALEDELGIRSGGTTADGLFTLEATSECLAACDVGPVLQVNLQYAVRCTPEKVRRLVAALRQQDAGALAEIMEAGEEAARELINAPIRSWQKTAVSSE